MYRDDEVRNLDGTGQDKTVAQMCIHVDTYDRYIVTEAAVTATSMGLYRVI